MTDDGGLTAQLRSLLERSGPFVSVYLDTEAATEEGARELELRWRALREEAERAGAAEAALRAVDDLVPGSQRQGDGLVVFASGGDVVFHASLPSPIADEVGVGPLPALLPLLEWDQHHPRCGLVLADRVGAEIHVLRGRSEDRVRTVRGDDFPITKVQPGGASQPRFQRRAENNWEGNAKEVAAEFGRLLATEHLDLVVIAGDVRAIALLQDLVEEPGETVAVDIGSRPSVTLEEISDELERVVAAYVGQTTEDLLARFREERGRQDLAVEGPEATLDALRMAQVGTLLVARDVAGTAWFSPSDLTQAASARAVLADVGLEDATEAALVDVLVRSALGTGADVRVIPALDDEHAPRAGVGALLRFRPGP